MQQVQKLICHKLIIISIIIFFQLYLKNIICYHYKQIRQVYKKVVNGQEDLWGEYCRLRKEVKQLVIEKKLNILE